MAGETLGNWLEWSRRNYVDDDGQKRELNRGEAARLIKIDPTYYGQIEDDKVTPSHEIISRMALAFKTDFDYVLSLTSLTPLYRENIADMPAAAKYIWGLVKRLSPNDKDTAIRMLEGLAEEKGPHDTKSKNQTRDSDSSSGSKGKPKSSQSGA